MSPAQARTSPAVGPLLREWRERRRLSQMDLALDAGVSTRHLSFVETGRAQPSREMVLHLAEQLDVPLRARNVLLLSAGYAPAYAERALDDPALAGARRAIDLVLAGHEPWPALVVDRHWQVIAANNAIPSLLQGVDPELTAGPVNALRLALHPKGLAPRIANLAQWRAHLLHNLHAQIEATADPVLAALEAEVSAYPVDDPGEDASDDLGGVAVPLRLRTSGGGLLSFISTTTVFGTPRDVTLAELALETFLPADAATAAAYARP
ncbi:helix-turn-helix transcriptional regulator [Phenylobacterium sp.]|uniref:helix-turn-helix domain-containing protein n=1 Tax=Phenylobacterium sp. TaxID=1871053 RepID=UPI0011FE6629|nr:helix-turn-helix transcriptional regulator [Phenylobacterium sp.]THD58542.1 MAG: XRE family transcriptional regulator [Phenylobacterium sp.]